jgi:hypothetical protein
MAEAAGRSLQEVLWAYQVPTVVMAVPLFFPDFVRSSLPNVAWNIET